MKCLDVRIETTGNDARNPPRHAHSTARDTAIPRRLPGHHTHPTHTRSPEEHNRGAGHESRAVKIPTIDASCLCTCIHTHTHIHTRSPEHTHTHTCLVLRCWTSFTLPKVPVPRVFTLTRSDRLTAGPFAFAGPTISSPTYAESTEFFFLACRYIYIIVRMRSKKKIN